VLKFKRKFQRQRVKKKSSSLHWSLFKVRQLFGVHFLTNLQSNLCTAPVRYNSTVLTRTHKTVLHLTTPHLQLECTGYWTKACIYPCAYNAKVTAVLWKHQQYVLYDVVQTWPRLPSAHNTHHGTQEVEAKGQVMSSDDSQDSSVSAVTTLRGERLEVGCSTSGRCRNQLWSPPILLTSYTAVYNYKSRTVFHYAFVLFRNGRATSFQIIIYVLPNRELSTGCKFMHVNRHSHNSAKTVIVTPSHIGWRNCVRCELKIVLWSRQSTWWLHGVNAILTHRNV
jgi:hypothetical protein